MTDKNPHNAAMFANKKYLFQLIEAVSGKRSIAIFCTPVELAEVLIDKKQEVYVVTLMSGESLEATDDKIDFEDCFMTIPIYSRRSWIFTFAYDKLSTAQIEEFTHG